jgi:dTDP-4-amino-4,6-dideoxygalactose transaminase
VPFPLGEPSVRLLALGRHALWHGLRALAIADGDEVLVPAYHHGSEVEVVAQVGATPRFYGGSASLEPVEDELEALMTPRTRALMLIHYVGFPQRATHWRRWCDDHGLFLIEDAAQAWLARDEGAPVGSAGDVAIYCLYKTFGIPNGAALVSRPPAAPTVHDRLSGAFAVTRRHAAWVRSRISLPALRPQPEAIADPRAEADFELGTVSMPAGFATEFLLRRMTSDVAATRRSNYEVLLSRLAGRVASPFDHVPPGASPFVFPLETSRKAMVLRHLRDAGIHAFDFWSFGHPLLDPAEFDAVRRRRSRTIGLPVHQELRPRDVDRIASVAGEAIAGDAR